MVCIAAAVQGGRCWGSMTAAAALAGVCVDCVVYEVVEGVVPGAVAAGYPLNQRKD